MTKYIADLFENPVTQIKPPKSAIDKCTNSKAISRIVLQGKGGEKTIVSRAGGITPDQEEEISRIRSERIDTSGSLSRQLPRILMLRLNIMLETAVLEFINICQLLFCLSGLKIRLKLFWRKLKN